MSSYIGDEKVTTETIKVWLGEYGIELAMINDRPTAEYAIAEWCREHGWATVSNSLGLAQALLEECVMETFNGITEGV